MNDDDEMPWLKLWCSQMHCRVKLVIHATIIYALDIN
jgi:hypothetical protein